MRLRPLVLILPTLLCLAAAVSCGDSGSSSDDSGPIGARQLHGTNLCTLLSEDTMAKLLGVKKLESDSAAGASDDCEWTAPVDGSADGKLQMSSYYVMEVGEQTTVGGLRARRAVQSTACEISVDTTGATDPAGESGKAAPALRVWFLGPADGFDDAKNCKAASRLAEAAMRALPEG
ncbi:hypothetical protein [Streptomyces scopuliridis]|uniref:DUF3558 domain-containing protein n=1 Tax=Streptomyces scopuliridis RB72 TaxID=1440053 RepID=A0A2T7T775_9ACTN|nr:hypothetical protein [Streptomyces scopuliridis]PVE10961.1 hypothetical protein Y717_21215 [Streptomyces scopuliridis RB72]